MIIDIKLFFSVATACLGIGYAARRRDNRWHRILMLIALAAAWCGAVVYAVGTFGLDLPIQPAFWAQQATGTLRRATLLAQAQQWAVLLALAIMSVQAVLGAIRHPGHRVVAWVAIPAWLFSWASTLVLYV